MPRLWDTRNTPLILAGGYANSVVEPRNPRNHRPKFQAKFGVAKEELDRPSRRLIKFFSGYGPQGRRTRLRCLLRRAMRDLNYPFQPREYGEPRPCLTASVACRLRWWLCVSVAVVATLPSALGFTGKYSRQGHFNDLQRMPACHTLSIPSANKGW